jgi:hypothetical protein
VAQTDDVQKGSRINNAQSRLSWKSELICGNHRGEARDNVFAQVPPDSGRSGGRRSNIYAWEKIEPSKFGQTRPLSGAHLVI